MIGCSRPMVSRLIAEMISAGRLAQNDKHYVVVDERLAEDPRGVPRANRSGGTRILKRENGHTCLRQIPRWIISPPMRTSKKLSASKATTLKIASLKAQSRLEVGL